MLYGDNKTLAISAEILRYSIFLNSSFIKTTPSYILTCLSLFLISLSNSPPTFCTLLISAVKNFIRKTKYSRWKNFRFIARRLELADIEFKKKDFSAELDEVFLFTLLHLHWMGLDKWVFERAKFRREQLEQWSCTEKVISKAATDGHINFFFYWLLKSVNGLRNQYALALSYRRWHTGTGLKLH